MASRVERGLLPRRGLAALALAGAAIAVAAGAVAQERPYRVEELSVLQRPRPDYQPLGMRVGQFILDPSVEGQIAYDSNIFATPSHTQSDFVTTLAPGFELRSDWLRHAFGLRAQGEFRKYALHGTEDVDNAAIAANGRYDIAPETYFLGGAGFQLLHEDRGSANPVNGKFPTEYTLSSANAGFVLAPYRLGLRIDGTIDSYSYDNVPAADGPEINEESRNRIIYALTPRISYRVTPQYDAFVRAVINRRQYTSTREADGLDRSSTGYQLDLGTSLDLAQLVTGEFYLGYLQQNYGTASTHTISGLDFGSNLLWNLTDIDSIRLNVARSVEESTVFGSLGYKETLAKLTLEHELLRNVVLLGSLTYLNADFQDVPGSSHFYEISIGGRYYINNDLSAGLEYDWRRRSPTHFLSGYTRQILALRLRAEL